MTCRSFGASIRTQTFQLSSTAPAHTTTPQRTREEARPSIPLLFVPDPPAVAYFPTPLPEQYRRRWGVSLPCSGWERVGPPRSNHQGTAEQYGLYDRHMARGTIFCQDSIVALRYGWPQKGTACVCPELAVSALSSIHPSNLQKGMGLVGSFHMYTRTLPKARTSANN